MKHQCHVGSGLRGTTIVFRTSGFVSEGLLAVGCRPTLIHVASLTMTSSSDSLSESESDASSSSVSVRTRRKVEKLTKKTLEEKEKLDAASSAQNSKASLRKMLSNDDENEQLALCNINPTITRLTGNKEALKVPSKRGGKDKDGGGSSATRRSKSTDYTSQLEVGDFVNSHLVDWCDASEKVYANRGRIAELSRGRLLSLLVFLTGWLPDKPKPGANKEEVCAAAEGEYNARGCPLQSTAWTLEEVYMFMQVQLAKYERGMITADQIGGRSWELPTKSTNGAPAAFPDDIKEQFKLLDDNKDPWAKEDNKMIMDKKQKKRKKTKQQGKHHGKNKNNDNQVKDKKARKRKKDDSDDDDASDDDGSHDDVSDEPNKKKKVKKDHYNEQQIHLFFESKVRGRHDTQTVNQTTRSAI